MNHEDKQLDLTAGMRVRMLAALADIAFLIGASLIVTVAVSSVLFLFNSPQATVNLDTQNNMVGLTIVLAFAVSIFLNTLFFIVIPESLGKGSVGKKLFGLSVLGKGGENPGLMKSLIRFFISIPPVFLPFAPFGACAFFAINYWAVSKFNDYRGVCLQDVLTGTYVIRNAGVGTREEPTPEPGNSKELLSETEITNT